MRALPADHRRLFAGFDAKLAVRWPCGRFLCIVRWLKVAWVGVRVGWGGGIIAVINLRTLARQTSGNLDQC